MSQELELRDDMARLRDAAFAVHLAVNGLEVDFDPHSRALSWLTNHVYEMAGSVQTRLDRHLVGAPAIGKT